MDTSRQNMPMRNEQPPRRGYPQGAYGQQPMPTAPQGQSGQYAQSNGGYPQQPQATGQFQAMPGQYGTPQYGYGCPQPMPQQMQPAKKKMALWKKLLIAFGVIVLIGGVGGALGSGGSSKSSSQPESSTPASSEASTSEAPAQEQAEEAPAPVEEKEDFTITDEAFDTSNQFSATITGVLTNNTDKDYSYVSVKYLLYDPAGNQIGSAVANITDLKAGGSWSFRAMTLKPADQIGRYEFEEVTAF